MQYIKFQKEIKKLKGLSEGGKMCITSSTMHYLINLYVVIKGIRIKKVTNSDRDKKNHF